MNTMTMHLIGASKYSFTDDSGRQMEGSYLLSMQPVGAKSTNKIGNEVTKIPIAYDKFDSLKGLSFPGNFEIDFEVSSISGKAGVHAFSVKKSK